MKLTPCPTDELVAYITEGRQACSRVRAQGKPVPETWEVALAQLHSEFARRMPSEAADALEVQEISRRLKEDGWVLLWSTVLEDLLAFANNDQAAAQVPGGIVVYTRSQLEQIVGKGHDPDMLKLIHEGKKHGARIRNQREVTS